MASSSMLLVPPQKLISSAVYPSICINKDGFVVEVHQHDGIQCRVGKVTYGGVQWWTGDICCDDDKDNVHYPRVAISSSGQVVIVYFKRSPPVLPAFSPDYIFSLISGLYYIIGQVDEHSRTITWKGRGHYDSGVTPAVSLLDDGTVIEVHETENPSGNDLYYHVGNVDATGSSIEWGPSHSYGEGKYPSISVTNEGVVVEMHKAQIRGKLWYHVGKLSKADKTITWGSSQRYDDGVDPSVAVSNSGRVLEAHASDGILRNLWCNSGVVLAGTKIISWSSQARKYLSGTSPAVAMNDEGVIVEVHKTSNRLQETILYTSGSLRK